MHPRYNPERDGKPQDKDCPGCESLRVIHLYCAIARKKARTGEGLSVAHADIPAEATEQSDAAEDGTGNGANKTPAV